jgi:hypothetical protein
LIDVAEKWQVSCTRFLVSQVAKCIKTDWKLRLECSISPKYFIALAIAEITPFADYSFKLAVYSYVRQQV